MSNGAVEIERKFLVTKVPDILGEGIAISQGYLFIGEDGSEVRMRKIGKKCFMTKKSGGDLQREEEEFEISQEEFDATWRATEGKRVEKTRYKIPHRGNIIELDVYTGGLTGLVTAEVEFASVEASQSFVPPEFLGSDVTNDKRFKNQQLALHGIPG